MTDKEKLGKISLITIISLLVIIFLAVIACSVIAFIKVYYFDNFHRSFLVSAFIKTVFLTISQNILFISIVYVTVVFSVLIDKTFLINLENSRLFFAHILRVPFFAVGFLAFFYFISIEFINPGINQELEAIRSNTKRANILVKKGHEHYRLKDFENARLFYNQYLLIVEQDDYVEDLVRKADYEISLLQENRDEPDILPETVFDYIKLAEYYFSKEEYLTAWYYYQFVLETGSAESRIAASRIDEIKKIYEYKHSIQEDLNLQWMSMPEKAIRRIYEIKNEAKLSMERYKYHEAYFQYKHLLEIDNNIRDVRNKREEVYIELSKISTGYAKFINALMLPGKKNAIFMPAPNVILYIGEIKKVIDLESLRDIHLCYDIRIYYLNDDFEIQRTVAAEYGEYKLNNYLTLYTYSENNESVEYYPVLERMAEGEYKKIINAFRKIKIPYRIKKGSVAQYIFDNVLSGDQKSIILGYYEHDFFNKDELVLRTGIEEGYKVNKIRGVLSDGYRRFFDRLYNGEGNYYSLNRPDDEQLIVLGKLYNNIEYTFFTYDTIEEEEEDKEKSSKASSSGYYQIFPFIYQVTLDAELIYDFSYNYNAALDLPLRRLIKLNAIMSRVLNEKDTFSFGFNSKFLKAAGADKASRLFMFIYLNMFAIAIAWRARSNHIGPLPPTYYIILSPVLLVFLYIIIKTFENVSTLLFTVLAHNLSYTPLMLIMSTVNVILIIISIIILATNRIVESKGES